MAAHVHDHDHHHHHHGHSHAPADFGFAFAVGIALNLGFVIIEAGYGVFSHSMALIADAGHNLGDVLGLGVARMANRLVHRAPSPRSTDCLRSASVLPAVSLLVSAVIVAGTWSLLRDSMKMTLHGVPPGVDEQAVRRFLEACPGVCALHDLHIWPMSTTETALTCHLIIPSGHPGDAELRRITDLLRDKFAIPHATIQIETDEQDCALHGHAV